MKRFQESIGSLKKTSVNVDGQPLTLPPQKPPRRRYSEQLSKYPTCSSSQKKGQNVSLPMNVKLEQSTGCESLPPSWIPVHNEEVKSSKTLNDAKSDSPPRKIMSNSFTRSSMESNFGSNTFPQFKMSNFQFKLNNASITCNKEAPSIASDFVKPNCNLQIIDSDIESKSAVELPKTFHRRHHSDPLIPNLISTFEMVSSKMWNENLFSTPLSSEYFSLHKDILLVLQEMEILKEINDKLWQNLCLAHRKMEKAKFSTSSGSNCNSSQFSEFICDIYKAQKDRSNCMEKRLKAAIEQRDSVIKMLEEVLQYMGRNYDLDGCNPSDMELAHQFQKIESTDNPIKVVETHHILLAYLNNSKKKLDSMAAKLQQCDEEKKQALEKVEKLQEDLIKWKTSRCLLHDDVRQWEANLLDTLCQVISQRDTAFSKISYLQEQMQHFQVHHSSCELQKSSFNDVRSSDYESMQKHDVMDENSEVNFERFQSEFDDAESRNKFDSSADEFKFLKYRIRYLSKSLDDEMKQRKAAEDNCHKLEQMLVYFGKRINGNTVGVPV